MEAVNNISVKKRKIRVGFQGLVSSLDEGVTDMAHAKQCYNFAFDKGVLSGKIGIDTATGYYKYPSTLRHAYPTFPTDKGIKKVFLYRKITDGQHDDRLVAHISDGSIWYTSVFNEDTWHQVKNLIMDGDVDVTNYNYNGKDMLFLSSEVDPLFVIDDGTPSVLTTAPKFSSITIHNERVFGSVNGNKSQVWFSDDFKPTSWKVSPDEAGFINFSDECGDVIKVVSFSNYLYVFREYGIFRLTAYGDQNDFLLKKIFTDTGRIYKNSIALCGDKIMYCAENGVFAFDGYDSVRVGKEIPDITNKNTLCASFIDDCYYIACNLSGDASNGNDAIVVYNVKNGSVSVLHGMNCVWLSPVKAHNGSDMLCVFADDNKYRLGMISESGKLFETALKKTYKSPTDTAEYPYQITVRDITLLCKYPAVIRIILDGKTYERTVKGSEKLQNVVVERSGSVLEFEIESTEENAYIAPLCVNVDLSKR